MTTESKAREQGDYEHGLAFIRKHLGAAREAILSRCGGPSELFVVETVLDSILSRAIAQPVVDEAMVEGEALAELAERTIMRVERETGMQRRQGMDGFAWDRALARAALTAAQQKEGCGG